MECKEARGVGRVDKEGQGSPEGSVDGGGDETSLEEEGAQQETIVAVTLWALGTIVGLIRWWAARMLVEG